MASWTVYSDKRYKYNINLECNREFVTILWVYLGRKLFWAAEAAFFPPFWLRGHTAIWIEHNISPVYNGRNAQSLGQCLIPVLHLAGAEYGTLGAAVALGAAASGSLLLALLLAALPCLRLTSVDNWNMSFAWAQAKVGFTHSWESWYQTTDWGSLGCSCYFSSWKLLSENSQSYGLTKLG